MIDSIIQFVTTHSEALIAGSFSVILILSGVLIYFNVFVIKPVDSEADFKKIEASIEKLLSKAEQMKAAPAVAGADVSSEAAGGDASAAETTVSNTDLLQLEAELADGKREIEKLKLQVESGGGAAKTATGDDNTPELLTKIKDLEDRLAEYEVIEDDIADLSLYKEENAKLKKQLASAGVAPADEAPEEAAAPAEEAEEVQVAAQAEAEPEPAFPDDSSDDDDIAAALGATEEEKTEEVVEAAADEPVAQESAPEEESSDDVFAEMSDSGEESDDPLAALGDIDTNKMLEELQGLEADAGADANVLEEKTDIDKMASEAEGLEKKS